MFGEEIRATHSNGGVAVINFGFPGVHIACVGCKGLACSEDTCKSDVDRCSLCCLLGNNLESQRNAPRADAHMYSCMHTRMHSQT